MSTINLRNVPDELYQKLKTKWVQENPKIGFHAFILSLLDGGAIEDSSQEIVSEIFMLFCPNLEGCINCGRKTCFNCVLQSEELAGFLLSNARSDKEISENA